MDEFTFTTHLGDVEIEVQAEINDYGADILGVTVEGRELPLANLTSATISALETEAQANHVGHNSDTSDLETADYRQRVCDYRAAA
jgi:hypothetical protein